MRGYKRKPSREPTPGLTLCRRVKGLLSEKGYLPYRLAWRCKGGREDALFIFHVRDDARGGRDYQQKAVLVRLTQRDRVWVRVFVEAQQKDLKAYLRACAGTKDVRFGTVPLSRADWRERIHPEDLKRGKF